jgi:hypothetical protein
MKDTEFYVDMREWQSFEDWFARLDVSVKDGANRTYLVTVTNSNGVFDYKINCEFPDALRNLSDDEKLQVFKNALNKWINKYRDERGNI